MKTIYFVLFSLFNTSVLLAQNKLLIPPTISGTVIDLNVQSGSQVFYGSDPTPTYGINGVWMAPTIIVNKGDNVTLNVINKLPVRTTMHWHGLHVSPENDGGPHQVINPSATWSPSFKIMNNAATFWYHPHGAAQTELQVSKGLAGLFIVKDSEEEKLNLPRTYAVDDIPLVVQSRAFDELKQIAIASDMDTALFVNGTLNPYFEAPAQVIRFRMLNGSSLRSYNFGFSNNQSFYQIGTDGGLLDSPVSLKRLILAPGERAEILVDFSGMSLQEIYLKSFASELPSGIYGAENVGSGEDLIHDYEDNPLNGSDFNLMKINIVPAVPGAITTIPDALLPVLPFEISSVNNRRTIVMDTVRLLPMDKPNRAEGPFGMNGKSFDMERVDDIVYLNSTEIWTLVNKTLVAHPFHIHDIQFNVIEKSGVPQNPEKHGWKDVVLVMPNDSVKFITKFTDFSDANTPYMYHCHLLHHEDDGMMGSFTVIDSTATNITESETNSPKLNLYPNPVSGILTIEIPGEIKNTDIKILNILGEEVAYIHNPKNALVSVDVSNLQSGLYFIRVITTLSNSTQQIQSKKFIKQ
ncbi:MAG: multicopper oxidase domain-containing protein [Bacteroidia bacterium]